MRVGYMKVRLDANCSFGVECGGVESRESGWIDGRLDEDEGSAIILEQFVWPCLRDSGFLCGQRRHRKKLHLIEISVGRLLTDTKRRLPTTTKAGKREIQDNIQFTSCDTGLGHRDLVLPLLHRLNYNYKEAISYNVVILFPRGCHNLL